MEIVSSLLSRRRINDVRRRVCRKFAFFARRVILSEDMNLTPQLTRKPRLPMYSIRVLPGMSWIARKVNTAYVKTKFSVKVYLEHSYNLLFHHLAQRPTRSFVASLMTFNQLLRCDKSSYFYE